MNNSDDPPVRPLQLGVIGAGQISQIVLPMLAGRGVAIAGLSDLNRSAAEALAAKVESGNIFSDPAELLASPAVEAVYIATPPATHLELVEASLEAGKHVICEKPWTLNARQARTLAGLAERFPDLRVGCCSSRFTFMASAAAARRLVREGALGTLRRVRVTAVESGGRPAGLDRMPAWKRTAAVAGGGVAADWCVYELEWLRSVLGHLFRPVTVSATLDYWGRDTTEIETGYHAVITCDSGLEVLITRHREVGPPANRVELRGEAAGADLTLMPGAGSAGKLHRLTDDGKSVDTTEVTPPSNDWAAVLAGPIFDLASAVRDGRQPSATAGGQVLVHTLLDAMYASARERRTVTI